MKYKENTNMNTQTKQIAYWFVYWFVYPFVYPFFFVVIKLFYKMNVSTASIDCEIHKIWHNWLDTVVDIKIAVIRCKQFVS